MSLLNLTGTTWVFPNSGINGIAGQSDRNFDVLFKDAGNDEYICISISAGADRDAIISYQPNGDPILYVIYGQVPGWHEGWDHPDYKTITFIGGTDVANADLIAWLEANATQQGVTPTPDPTPTPTPTPDPSTTGLTFDLTTLNLSAGTHRVEVKARATGYNDSDFSNEASYTVSSGYTITINYSASGGHAEDYGTQYYSIDNGVTWIRMDHDTTITASQIKFKIVSSESSGDDDNITIDLNGNTVLYVGSEGGTFVSENYVISGNSTVNVYNYYECFAENTKIKLANGEDKLVQDITYEDELKVWDFHKGKFTTSKPCWIKIEQVAREYHRIVLDNGIILNLVGPKGHRLFSLDEQKMLYSNEIVGHKVYTLKGIATVVSCETIKQTVKYYNITTDKYYDCFANDVLTGSRLNNMFHISAMKYDNNVRLISKKEEAERWAVRERYRKC